MCRLYTRGAGRRPLAPPTPHYHESGRPTPDTDTPRRGPCGAVISQVDLRVGGKVYRLGMATYRISELAGRASTSEHAPVACTLGEGDQGDRIGRWRYLLTGARAEATEGGLRFRLATEAAGPLAELATAERRCCAFFEFTLSLDGDGLRFEVRAPVEAVSLMAEVFGTAE